MSTTPQAMHAQRTSVLIQAIDRLAQDFTRRMGSGIVVHLSDLEGKPLMDRFMVAAEDMEGIKPAIIASLKATLERRKIMLAQEIRDIEKALN